MEPTPATTLTRNFSAAPATVFRAWSDAEHVKRWFAPAGYTVPYAKVKMEVGGAFDVCMRDPDGIDHLSRGRVVAVIPNESLAFEMTIAGPDGRQLFTAHTEVTFETEGAGTRMQVVQSYVLFDPAAKLMVQGAPVGWSQTLDRLDVVLSSGVEHGVFQLHRVFDAKPQAVFKAFTDPEAKARWFGPRKEMADMTDCSMDVRVGGRETATANWRSGMVSRFEAIYHDVVPDQRLVYSYDLFIDGKKISVSLATVEIKAEGTKTRLTVTEQGVFLDGYEDNGARERGTSDLLDALVRSVS